MGSHKTPTIKGIFVKSHVEAVRREKGDEGLKLLEEKYAKPLNFKNSENVPLRDEVRLIEYALEILSDKPIPKEDFAYEAGKLHFRNFLTTPFAKILFPFFKNRFRLVTMQAHNIAGHVFEGVRFYSVGLADKSVKVVMKNNDYPIDHFRGFLQEWMEYSGLQGTVIAEDKDGAYEYTLEWK